MGNRPLQCPTLSRHEAGDEYNSVVEGVTTKEGFVLISYLKIYSHLGPL